MTIYRFFKKNQKDIKLKTDQAYKQKKPKNKNFLKKEMLSDKEQSF